MNAQKNSPSGVQDFNEVQLDRADQGKQMLEQSGAIVGFERVSDSGHLCDPMNQSGGCLLSFTQE